MIITKSLISASFGIAVFAATSLVGATDYGAYAQEETTFQQKKLNGPRLGVTYALQNDIWNRSDKFMERIEEAGMGAVISQFGWHFEWLVAPASGGPAFVTEFLPFLGAVEYSKVVPSASIVFGIRMPNGIEFGMGPNVSTTFDVDNPVYSSLLLAAGYSMDFGEVSIPVNVALLTSGSGNRVSLVFGYAMPDRKK